MSVCVYGSETRPLHPHRHGSKVFKLCQHCRRMATGVFQNFRKVSKRVSWQQVDSQKGGGGGRSSALQNLDVYIKDSLPLGLNS